MKVIHKHNIYLDKRQSNIYIDVMQADAYTRVLEFSLYSGGVAWNVPEGVDVAVAYIGSSGKGIYDTLPDGAAACAVNGNVVTAVVAPQAVAMDGNTNLSIIFTDDAGHQLAAFCVTLKVERNPAVNATKPPDYINLRQWLSKELADMVRGSTTVTITQKGDKLAADKIYAELHAAHVAGQTVHCKLPDGSVLALATADENGLLFQGENGRDYQQIIIRADGTITYKSGKYALLGELVTDATIGVYPSGDGYESTDTLEDLQESAKAGRTIVCNLEVGDGELLRLPMTKREDDAFHFSAVFEGKEYLVTINADGVTVEQSEVGSGGGSGNPGEDGGYYTPTVIDNGDGTMTVSFAASNADMPAVDTVTVVLPEGQKGYSPTANVEQTDSGAIIHIYDKNGHTFATVENGKNGGDGKDGNGIKSAVLNDDYTLTLTFDDGTSYTTPSIRGATGPQGEIGPQGETGPVGPQGPQGEKGDNYTLTDADKAEIAGLIDAAAATPDYIVAEAERVVGNVQATRTARSLVFPVMSDFHLFAGNSNHDASLLSAQYAGMGVEELKKRIHLDFIGYLGDYTWGAADHTAQQIMADITAMKETTDPTLTEIWCVGNHDLNYGKNRDRLLSLDEIYSHIGANADGVKPYESIERGYGYLDFEQQKIRVIYLNTCDASELVVVEGESAPAGWISPTQIQWLADTALDFSEKSKPSEWGIVIMSHHPLHDGASDADNTMKILENYRDGLSGELSCTIRTETAEDGTKTYPQQKVVYDFSGVERAEIICNIHGHNHNCGYSQISSSTRTGSAEVAPWLWRFCVPNICANRYNTGLENAGSDEYKQGLYGEFDASGNPVEWTKETGTAKATSFCVVNIDRKSKKIYAHIFGAGKDRVISYDEEYVPAEYSVSVTAKNCTASSDNPATITENGTATLVFTAADGYALPDSVSVTGASYTWDKASGTLTLTSPTGNVGVTVTAVEVVVEPTYTNQLDTAGYTPDVKISSSGGGTTSAAGYAATGFIPIGYGSNNNAQGEQVVYLKNIEATVTDSNVRIAFYDADKAYIGLAQATTWKDVATESSIMRTLDANGYVNSIDVSAVTSYYYRNQGKTPAYFRLCSKGIDGDSIITVNEPIE